MEDYFLAYDMGASSGRSILSWMEDGRIWLEELNRFDNHLIERNGHLTWDIDSLWQGILEGLRVCKGTDRIPGSIGIDTWAVDYVLLDENGSMIGDAVCYRDGRTEGMREEADRYISREELYERTGIQYQPFNTIYQLLALKKEHPDQLEQARSLLMLPDYFNYLLTGVMKQEYTNATSTSLVNAGSHEWDMEIIRRLGLPERLFHKLSVPGTTVGNLRPELSRQIGFDTTVILPATHDTGSAFLSAPYSGKKTGSDKGETLILSSGTWSLLGVEQEAPITSTASQAANFTNEGGAWYRYRYLKNIMGLWMIQSVRRELNGVSYVQGGSDGLDGNVRNKEVEGKASAGRASESEALAYGTPEGSLPEDESLEENERAAAAKILAQAQSHGQWSFPDLIEAAKNAEHFTSEVDVNDNRFLAPKSMIMEVIAACEDSGQKVPETVGELMQCLYLSLTTCYRKVVKQLSSITGKSYSAVNIIGGGCQDAYLDQMTAARTGLTVYAGPVEGTAIGNLAMQMITAGVFEDLDEARKHIVESFDVHRFRP